MQDIRFEEKILYKCHQHWIIPLITSLKLIGLIILPSTVFIWFMSDYSTAWTVVGFFILSVLVLGYEHYLWHHSWLFIGNQKVTLSVRNGIFSQYAMNIRYRNIRDSAVSKNNLLGFLLKYGTLFMRSTNAEGDFVAKYVPKVGKVYALVNALSRYSDDERAQIETIEQLHAYHQKKEYTKESSSLSLEQGIEILQTIPGVTDVIELSPETKAYITHHEEAINHGVHDTVLCKHVVCFLHDSGFRLPEVPIVQTLPSGETRFPAISFPELLPYDPSTISGSPGILVHRYLLQFFPYAKDDDATVIVGWGR